MSIFQLKRQHWLALLVAVVSFAVCAPRAGAVLKVTNGNFETGGGVNVDDVTSWFDPSNGTFWQGTWQDNASWITPNGSTIVVLGSYEGGAIQSTISSNVNVGNYLYQGIGTADGTNTLDLSFDWGAPNDDPGGRELGLTVGVYAYNGGGGFTPDNNTDIYGATNVTLLDSVSYTMTSTGVDGLITNISLSLDISGAGTDALYLRFNNYRPANTESWPILDNVIVGNDYPPFQPIVGSPTGTGVTNPVTLEAQIIDYGAEFVSASMELDGSPVTPTGTNDLSGGTNIVYYDVGSLPAGTTHTGKVVAVGTTGDPVTNEWTFTMEPPLTVVSTSPTGAGAPSTPQLVVIIADGDSELDTGPSLKLYLDDTPLTVLTDTPVVGQTEIVGNWATELDPGSTHTGKVVYAAINPAAGPFTNTWIFSIVGDPGYGIYIPGTNAPAYDADDVTQFEQCYAPSNNIGGVTNDPYANDGWCYVAFDRDVAQGQLFTTASGSPYYELTSVWVQHVDYPTGPTWANVQAGDEMTIRIIEPIDSSSFNVLHTEALTVVSNSITGSGGAGTGLWLEFRLLNPVILSGDTQYGFDMSAPDDDRDPFFEMAAITNNPYAGGYAYTTAGRTSTSFGTVHATSDRTFVVTLSPSSGGGPTVTPNITAFSVSGGSATLTWDSETGVNYGVRSKSALTAGSWTEVTNVPGAAGSTMATVPAASSEEFFSIEGN